MPLRLNLLAETHAEEELRRRDPVKRGIKIGAGVVGLVLLWAGLLQFQIIRHQSHLAALEEAIATQNKNYSQIAKNEKRLAEVNLNLISLHRLATNRFVWGKLLNALQTAIVPDVQLVALRSEQAHIVTEGTRPKTNAETGKVLIGKAGTAVQKMRLQFDAKDYSASPGDQVSKFKAALVTNEYFRTLLGKTNEISLRGLNPPNFEAALGRSVVIFSLECRPPDLAPKSDLTPK